jgi:hypothetical protein
MFRDIPLKQDISRGHGGNVFKKITHLPNRPDIASRQCLFVSS